LHFSRKNVGSVHLSISTADDGCTLLNVSDDGVGVSPDAVQKLFEPFHTTDAGGTGLGLYIARELCEANCARIDYRRSDLGGACFCIKFGVPMNIEKGV
jgi:two-component system sensor histidine kinase PilS (NtrC family)